MHLTVLFNPVFNCSSNLLSSWVDKVTTETYHFVSFFSNVSLSGLLTASMEGYSLGLSSLVALLDITQFSD